MSELEERKLRLALAIMSSRYADDLLDGLIPSDLALLGYDRNPGRSALRASAEEILFEVLMGKGSRDGPVTKGSEEKAP
jgi:hypothetical protein